MNRCLTCGGTIAPELARAASDGFYHVPECPNGFVGTYGPFEHHRMPAPDYECFYRDDRHSYWERIRDNGGGSFSGISRIPGISTISGYVDACQSTGGLVKWAEREGRAGRDTSEASALGTAAHDYFEAALCELPPVVLPGIEGFARAIEDFLDRYALAPLQTECVVYSKEYRFAGRFDARVNAEGETWLLDLKSVKETGKALKPKYNAQLAGYEIAAQECGYGASDRRVILEVTQHGDYTLYEAKADAEDFLGCLAGFGKAKGLRSRLTDLLVPLAA